MITSIPAGKRTTRLKKTLCLILLIALCAAMGAGCDLFKIRDAEYIPDQNAQKQAEPAARQTAESGDRFKRNTWNQAAPGLDAAVFDVPGAAAPGDSGITVVRIDPARWELVLLSADEHGDEIRTTSEWAQEFDLAAAINAGMYREDGLTSVGFMKNFSHVNNRHVVKHYKAALAFNPEDDELPPAQLIDFECQNFGSLKKQYQSVVQSIRMIDCDGNVVWSQQDEQHSITALAADTRGRIMFTFTRTRRSVHDFAQALLDLPLDVRNAMYLEGGAQSTLYLDHGGVSFEKVGATDMFENTTAWPLPNVIGVRVK